MSRITSVNERARLLLRPLLVAGCALFAACAALAILAQPAATELASDRAADSAAAGGAATGLQQTAIGDHYEHVDTWSLPSAMTEVLPVDVAVGRNDAVYIADATGLQIHALDGAGNTLVMFGADGQQRHRPPSESEWPLAVDVDLDRDLVYVLWVHPMTHITLFTVHGLDGTLLHAEPKGGAAVSGDLAVHGATGDLFVYLDRAVYRYDTDTWQRTVAAAADYRQRDAADARIAVFDDGRVAVCVPSYGLVRVHGGDAKVEWELDVNQLGATPLAVDVDASDVLHVLLSTSDQPSPDDAFVLSLDAAGQQVDERSMAEVGAPQTPLGDANQWPIGLDVAGANAVFSTIDPNRFLEVHLLPDDAPSQRLLRGGRAESPYRPPTGREVRVPPTRSDGLAVARTHDGDLLVLDDAQGRLARIGLSGESAFVGYAPANSVDLAVGPDGAAYVSTSDDRLVRMETTGPEIPTWERDCDCEHGGRLAVAGTSLYVSQPLEQRVAAMDLGSQAVLAYVELPDAVGLWPSDIVAGSMGRLFTGDIILSQVQSWRSPAAPDVIWQAGLLAGPRRLAAARLDDGSDVVATFMADGFVELHAAMDGNLLSRWKPLLADGSSPSVADIAVAPDGRVFVADKEARALRVFAPAVGPTPTPEAEAAPTPTPSDRSCRVEGDKVAGPPRIVLGETAQVTLTLSADCPDKVRIVGADIMLVMDVSGSMGGPKLEAAKAAARNFVTLLDVRYHRSGLVAFSNGAQLISQLTTDVGAVLSGIDTLVAEGGTNITGGITVARDHLLQDGRSEALPVIVLLSDGAHNVGDPPSGIAASARNSGVQIYAIGLGAGADETTLQDITGRPDRYFYAPTPDELFPIYEEILREVLSSLAGNLIIDDEMADDIEYVAGSADPVALAQEDRLRWGRSLLPSTGVTMTYDILPGRPGLLPTNRQAVADYNDGDGVRRQFVFPVPVIEVVTPTPTPTNTPTVTPTPTNTPTATPVPLPAYLPILYKDHCLPGTAHADIVLLIDTSSSMDGDKLAQAKAAAATFVGLLNLRYDQAAIVGFDSAPHLASPLTADRERLQRAIDSLSTRTGTVIDEALWAAAEVLSRSPQRKHDNVAVVIMLSDGAHNGPAGDVLVASETVRRSGALLFVIGLGGDADVALLEAVADSGRYFFAPDGAALEGIYRSIAVKIPCR